MEQNGNWVATQIKRLDGIAVGTVLEFVYQATQPLRIAEIKPSCGCTSAKYNEKTNQLKVLYKAESIPKHLKHQGWFYAAKHVVVKYATGDPDRLTFVVKVIDNGISV